MEKTSRILITGASGLIGSALVRLLKSEGYENLLIPSHKELDLCSQAECHRYFGLHRPQFVIHLAAIVGGIEENNKSPAVFIAINTIMHCNIFHCCCAYEIEKILFPGSACAYPKDAEQPIKESSFLAGIPEPTNIAYAVAKINGIVMAQSYAKQYGMSVVLPMVANTYGLGDRSGHVIPQMIERFKVASDNVILWGTGSAIREFIYADDVAAAFLFLMQNYNSPEIINVGTGEEISIRELAGLIAEIMDYKGIVGFDSIRSDGMPRKCLDSSLIRAVGWESKISLDDGLRRVINSDYQ